MYYLAKKIHNFQTLLYNPKLVSLLNEKLKIWWEKQVGSLNVPYDLNKKMWVVTIVRLCLILGIIAIF